jgi:hypothetical protein
MGRTSGHVPPPAPPRRAAAPPRRRAAASLGDFLFSRRPLVPPLTKRSVDFGAARLSIIHVRPGSSVIYAF